MEYVILTDEEDHQIGVMEKLQAHKEGRLHRAVSVFIFNRQGQMLLQQRAAGKYHSAGLWTNTCCSHPRPDEDTGAAAARRLQEEMGISCPLLKVLSFVYKAVLENGITEYEFDHVYTGITDDAPQPDASEAAAWKYAAPQDIKADIALHEKKYTEWFKICMSDFYEQLSGKKQNNA